ncbi:hypothetical protein M0222_18520 [Myxococcus fulvus]|nr:hypothetical protein [Myxococcus fulvus]
MGTRPMSIRARSLRSVSSSLWGLVLVTLLSATASRANERVATAQRALDFVSADAVTWTKDQGCTSCHRHGATLFGLTQASANGFDLDTVTTNGRTNRENMERLARDLLVGQDASGSWVLEGVHYRNAYTSYAAFGLAGYDAKVGHRHAEALARAADWAVSTQELSGRWVEDYPLRPVGASNMGVTARLMTALAQARVHAEPARAARYQDALRRAAAYLREHLNDLSEGPFDDAQRYTYQVAWTAVGLKAAGPGEQGENTAALESVATRLLATRTLGDAPGWGGLDGEAPDETSTSFALYALCLAGRTPEQEPRVARALEWLTSRQAEDGGWGVGTSRHPDIPTTFATLALTCFPDKGDGVSVTVDDAANKPVAQALPHPQRVTYTLWVLHEGARADTFTLEASGGLPGWTATLDRTTVTLAPGERTAVTLSVGTPVELAPSLTSEVQVTATSMSRPGVSSATWVTAYTNPPPPTEGLETTTTVLAGAQLTVGRDNALSARVTSADGWRARGPGQGQVTFQVAGVTVGTDHDADGDGVYSVVWRPRGSWEMLGASEVRAVYSGVTLQPREANRLGSTGTRAVEILPSPDPLPSVTLCGLPDFMGETSLGVCGFVTALAPGATIESAAFILHGEQYPVVPEESGGFVWTELPLRDGLNVIQLVATDTFGGRSSQQATVRVDAVAPGITVLYPAEGSMVGSLLTEVRVWVDDASPVRVETNWVHVTEVPAGGGLVAHELALTPGANEVLIRATDAAGHVTEHVLTFWVDAEAPWLVAGLPDGWLVGPRPGDMMDYELAVYSESATRVEVTPGGGSYEVPRGGGVFVARLPLVPGDNVFTMVATSETGLSTTLTRTVRYDDTPPRAQLLSPGPDEAVSGIVVLEARVTDDVSGVRSVAFTRDGSGIRAGTDQGDGVWTAELDTRELLDGPHTVEVWMEDSAGNFIIQTFPFVTRNQP